MMVTNIGTIISSLQSALFNLFHIYYLIFLFQLSCEISTIIHIFLDEENRSLRVQVYVPSYTARKLSE